MSMRLMCRALETKVGNPLRKLVLLKLADNANDHGECWPSYQYIADQCEISKRSVITHIEQLVSDGFLTKEIRKGPKRNSSNLYCINISKIGGESPAPLTAVNGESPAPDSESPAPQGGESPAPRIYHSLESPKEPKEREPALSNDNVATPEQLDTLFSHSTDTRRKFEMSFDWEPDRNMVCDRLRHTKVPVPPPDQLTNFICEFRNHFEAQSMRQTEHQWIAKLVQWIKRDNVNQSERPKSKQRQPDNFGQIDYRAGAEEMGFEVI